MNRPRSRLGPAIALAGILLAFVAAYMASYFATSKLFPGPPGMRLRTFKTEWQSTFYHPAAFLESVLTGRRVETSHYLEEG
jgi:hypothetical protein